MADDREIEDVESDRTETKYDRKRDGVTDDPEHRQALERLQITAEAYDKQNKREVAALRFQVPELHWQKADRDARAGDTIGDITIPARPTVSIPKIDQPIQLVLNQERAAHLGVKVEPLDERGDDDTAEVQTGLYRSIERESRAGLARSWAFERAVKAGRGAWRVVTVPAPNFKQTGDQDIRIKRILWQESAFLDPFAIEPDEIDAEFGHILEWIAWSKYKRIHKNIKGKPTDKTPGEEERDAEDMPSILATMSDAELVKLQDTCPEWIRGEGEARAVLIAEYMFLEDRPDDENKAVAAGWRPGEDKRVQWRMMNAVEFMDYRVIHCAYIPIVRTIGRELIPFEGERRWMGMYEPNADGQLLFNYAASNAVEAVAQEPRNTWMLAEGQEENHEREFLLANVKNFPYIRYRPKTIEGTQEVAPPPQRTQADTSKLSLSLEMLKMASEFVNAGTATFEPSLGKNSPNVRTKGGTLALQAQSEQANSNWLDNQSEISMTKEAKIILSMLPFYYDRPGRIARLVGIEEKDTRTVMLNAPFRMEGGRPVRLPYTTPDEKAEADAAVKDPNDKAKRYDLMAGRYGAVVSIGKGYKSRIDQGADELGQLFQAEPELFKILGDIYLRFRDFPGHAEAAERIKKMLPPNLQNQEGDEDPAIQLDQAKQALQQMQAQMQEMAKALETDKVKADANIAQKQIDARAKVAVAQMNNQLELARLRVDLEIAKLNNQTKLAIEDGKAAVAATTQARDHAFDADQAERDRAADLALAAAGRAAGIEDGAVEHARALELGDQAHQQDLEAGDVEHQQALEAGDADAANQAALSGQEHGQTLEQTEQAAELAPEPAEGAE